MSRVQASLSLPGSPFNLRRGSRGSHQFTLRNNRRMVVPPGDRKPLVLSTYLDAQEHLPYADDSQAVTPMSEENGAMVVPIYNYLGGSYQSESNIPVNHCDLQVQEILPTLPTDPVFHTLLMVISFAAMVKL